MTSGTFQCLAGRLARTGEMFQSTGMFVIARPSGFLDSSILMLQAEAN